MKTDYGQKPELAWLPVAKLSVDPKYQRDTGSTRSRHLIKKIIENFRWPRFSAVLVVKHKTGWHVIDGQHRVEAARGLAISHVPAIELPHSTPAEAAADFVAINNDRVSVTAYHIHYAMIEAEEPTALAIERICKAVGVSICRYPTPSSKLKDGQTLAVGTIKRLVVKGGEAVALDVMKAVVARVGLGAGAVNAGVIREIAGEMGVWGGKNVAHGRPLTIPTNAKQRWCLSCREPFASMGPGHRICDACKETSGYKEAAVAI